MAASGSGLTGLKCGEYFVWEWTEGGVKLKGDTCWWGRGMEPGVLGKKKDCDA